MILTKKFVVPAICGVVAVGGVIYAVTRPSDESQIRTTLERLAKSVEPRHNESNIFGTVARISGVFKETLTERVELRVPEIRDLPSQRADLAKTAAQVSLHYPGSKIDLTCASIDIAEDKTTARADCTANLSTSAATGGPREDERRVNFALRKDDGWRVTSINVADRGVK